MTGLSKRDGRVSYLLAGRLGRGDVRVFSLLFRRERFEPQLFQRSTELGDVTEETADS